MIIKTNQKNNLGLTLFSCIILSLIPLLITSLINPTFIYSGSYSLTVGIVFFIQVIIIVYYYVKVTKKLFHPNLLLLSLVFMISQAITLFQLSMRGIEWNSFDLINVFIRFATVLLFVSVPAIFSISREELNTFMFYLVFLGLIASVYNLAINFEGMLGIMSINNPYAANFKSFYLGRNSFAQLLFFCMIANTIIFYSNNRIINWISYIVFGLNIFTTLSRTVIATVSIFFIVFFIIYFKNKYITKVLTVLFVSIVFFAIVKNEELANFISTMLMRTETGTTGRSVVWNVGYDILDQTSWMFGTGYITSRNILSSMGHTSQFHNFFIEVLVGGGIVDLLLHLSIFAFVIKKIRTIYRNDRLVGIVYFSGYIGLGFYSSFESASFFSMGYVDTLFRIVFITIPILYSNSFEIQKSQINVLTRVQ